MFGVLLVHRPERRVDVLVPARKPRDDALLLICNMKWQRLRKISNDAAGRIANFLFRRGVSVCKAASEAGKRENALVALQQQVHDVRRLFGIPNFDQHFKFLLQGSTANATTASPILLFIL